MNGHLLRIGLIALITVEGALAPLCLAEDSAATCSCDRRSDQLVIRYTPDITQEKPAWGKTPPPVHFMSLLVLDKSKTMVEETKQHTFSCRLKSDTFEVKLESGVPNPNLLGRCGGAVTGIVTVKRNGMDVLKEQEFEAMNCHERQKYLKSITFKDGSAKPALVYGTYEE